jgi:hypothetical protein
VSEPSKSIPTGLAFFPLFVGQFLSTSTRLLPQTHFLHAIHVENVESRKEEMRVLELGGKGRWARGQMPFLCSAIIALLPTIPRFYWRGKCGNLIFLNGLKVGAISVSLGWHEAHDCAVYFACQIKKQYAFFDEN